jgi:hypothetical protein
VKVLVVLVLLVDLLVLVVVELLLVQDLLLLVEVEAVLLLLGCTIHLIISLHSVTGHKETL